MKKLLYLVPCLLAACTADVEQPTQNSPQKATAQDPVQQIIERATRALNNLKNVQSKAEADAIADDMFAVEALMEEMHEEGKISPEEAKELIRKPMQNAGFSAQTMSEIERKLEENHYYGSAKLADMYDGDDELPPTPIDFPEALQKEWGAILQQEIAEHQLPFSGGPGFTRDTAWEVTLSFGKIDAHVHHLENALKKHAKLLKVNESITTNKQGKTYEKHYYAVKVGDKLYKLLLWFDMTECVDDIYMQ